MSEQTLSKLVIADLMTLIRSLCTDVHVLESRWQRINSAADFAFVFRGMNECMKMYI